jgi:Rod binding domain-containing protein
MNAINFALAQTKAPNAAQGGKDNNPALRKAFDSFVGETFYGQMLKEMRKSVGKAPGFNGGQAEEMFTERLDQSLATKMANSGSHNLSGSMYNLFTQGRR